LNEPQYAKTNAHHRDYFPSQLFKRIPNRRVLPDYHEIIKDPVAISTLKQKIQRKQYTGIPEFVRDFAMIVHNAQVYNRPNSGPVRDVFLLQTVFKDELKKLVDEGLIKEEETVFPDLGEIPDATPEPTPVSEDEDDNDDEDEEDEDDDGADDDSEDGRRKRRRRGGRTSISGRKGRDDDEKAGEPKRRGRPPKVDTPMEARIKAILKGLRKPKDKAGNLKIRHFERLPDKQEYPSYFAEIKDPIALDMIKKKAKRKKYQSIEHFMKDIDLLFNNAKQFNEDGSEIYQDAADLHAEAQKLAEIEKAKPDDEYLMEDGRRPLPNGILHKNELWRVGDWVHLQNQNDVTKPIVAQIYRTWEDTEGQKWINACWYYRPEQTVHQYEKHFWPNEVVKTGQYRDHQIDEVLDRCFVMFFTRYTRGRPRNISPTTEVYVCEARYNEEKHRFNKIKTWASCLPDEVRDKDYEMDLFDTPRKIKKVPSPLKHLLKDDTKESGPLPTPQWGHPNAPPIVGGIHKQPRDENVSPSSSRCSLNSTAWSAHTKTCH
jgi:chromatin structure-remodeling complex subunit RSC1/2